MSKLLSLHNTFPDVKYDGFKTFKVFCAVKAHFTAEPKSNAFNLQKSSMTRVKYSTFLNRKDYKLFNRIADRFTIQSNYKIFLHNFIVNNNAIAFDLLDISALQTFKKRNANIENVDYNYNSDIEVILTYMKEHNMTFRQILNNDDIYSYPIIMKLMLNNHIKIESVLILDSFLNLVEDVNNNITDVDPMWPYIYRTMYNYKKILIIDNEMAKKHFLKKINESV